MTERTISEVMRELGSRGGAARARRLSAEDRARISELASRAARAKQLACTHQETEERTVSGMVRVYCHSCRRRLA